MTTLALHGGTPTFNEALDWRKIWPPTNERTAAKLLEIYHSRLWTAFDQAEGLFAADFAKHHDTKHGIFMVNGTVTLQCALGAHGIGPGDEVIVPALTWYATAIPAHYLGATPVFVDILEDTLCIDPNKVEAAITPRTKAIIPVHLYGSMADMDRIMAIAAKHRLRVIEDCAHVQGGIWDGRRVGSIGDVGSFSFQHSKAMSSAEGGICITNDERIAERIFRMKHIGYGPGQQPGKADSGPPDGLLCYPFRATAFQAAILHDQLQDLDDRLRRYAEARQYLEKRLAATTQIRFQTRPSKVTLQGYFGWVMIFDHPSYEDIPLKTINAALQAEGVQASHTWDPVYRFILFNLPKDKYRIDQPCEVTERMSARILWLNHSFLGVERQVLEKIGDAIEKVMCNVGQLRQSAKSAATARAI